MPASSPDIYAYFVDTILQWYQQHGRHDLPWRRPNITPYEVWVSEVMLQQTQVSRVIDYYTRFLDRFPTIESLAATNWESFFPYYQGLGYYRRGRNMLATAQKIVSEQNGIFPSTKPELLALPGVGEYTANAILSFGRNQPHLAFDTNHQRVWGRYLHGDKSACVDPATIKQHLPANTPYRELNAAVMDFANLVYTNRNPDIEHSPLQPHCRFWQTNGQLEDQPKLKRSSFPQKDAQTILILHRDHTIYYSSEKDRYAPFVLPAPINTRARIQRYFRERYELTLSVRPPFRRAHVRNVPTLFTRAQIQLGTPTFATFEPTALQSWLKSRENDTISFPG